MADTPLLGQIHWYLDVLAARPASPATIATYRTYLLWLERFAAQRGRVRAEDLDQDLLLAATLELMRQGGRDRATGRTHSKGNEGAARILVVATRGLMRELRKRRGLPVADFTTCTAPRVPERLQPRVDLRSFEQLERALEGRAAYPRFPRFVLARDRALVQVLFETGLRAIEASRLDVSDVDLGYPGAMLTVREGKGRKPRQIGIADPDEADGGETVRRLRAYLALRAEHPAAAHEPALWLGVRGRRMSPAALRTALRRLCEEAALPEDLAGVHAFRRGWFTAAYRADPRELPILAARMGWGAKSERLVGVYTRGAMLNLAADPRPLITRARVPSVDRAPDGQR